MKKIYHLLLIGFAFTTSYSQSTLELAKQLDTEKTKLLKNNITEVLQFSTIGTPAEKELVEKLALFLNNPFNPSIGDFDLNASIKALQSMVNQLPVVSEYVKGGNKNTPLPTIITGNSKSIETLSKSIEVATHLNSDIVPGQALSTKIIDATAKFLVDRTKQELSLSFFENFREELKKDISITLTNGTEITLHLKDIFPNTYLLLDNRNYLDIPTLGEVWIVAFKKDSQQLPKSIHLILEKNELHTLTQGAHFAVLSFKIIERLKDGEHPLQVIEEVSETATNYQFETDKILGILDLFSSHLLKEKEVDGVKKMVLITNDDLKKLDESSLKYFTGLVYQAGVKKKILAAFTIGNTNLESHINETNYLKFYQAVKSARTNYQKFDQLLTDLQNHENDTPGYYQKYAAYLGSFYQVFDESLQSLYRLADKTELYYTSDYYQKLKPLVTSVIGFNKAIGEEHYAECLLLTTDFLKHLLETDRDNEIIKKFGYYGNFITDVIYASKNNTDVKKIIENYAMPVASYRIKRLYRSSWDINAFPGLYFGYEFSKSNSVNYGVTAPIGISYSFKNKTSEDLNISSSSSTSLFLSVIDIGAPFSYRFSHDEAEGLPEDIVWEQVFSPGLFYIFGLKDMPLSISAGLQFTPLLRKITENNVLDTKNVVRASVSLLVDIPLFNLYKSGEKK